MRVEPEGLNKQLFNGGQGSKARGRSFSSSLDINGLPFFSNKIAPLNDFIIRDIWKLSGIFWAMKIEEIF